MSKSLTILKELAWVRTLNDNEILVALPGENLKREPNMLQLSRGAKKFLGFPGNVVVLHKLDITNLPNLAQYKKQKVLGVAWNNIYYPGTKVLDALECIQTGPQLVAVASYVQLLQRLLFLVGYKSASNET